VTGVWLRGLLRRRPGALLAAATGIGVAVALIACLGSFLAASKATMTARAAGGVGVDWQVQVAADVAAATVDDAVKAEPGTRATSVVTFASTPGLTAMTGGTSQSTGPGTVLGISAGYATLFPAEVRLLTGDPTGALLAQQTAANLHAGPGDEVTIARTGLDPVSVRVSGVVELPLADSLFQTVGAPVGSGSTAPPDNVVLLPSTLFSNAMAPIGAVHPEQLSAQVHVQRSHTLPADPAAAYAAATGAAHHMDVTLAGAGQVGDNLGATLDAARQDALYAQALFLFLGLPGAVLAGLLTSMITGTGATRRAQEQALLRTRGASLADLTRLATVEAVVVGVAGGGLGLAASLVVGRLGFGAWGFGGGRTAWAWMALAVLAGLAVAALTILVPARRAARAQTVAAGRALTGRAARPRWMHWWVDAILLAGASAILWLTRSAGYALVLAPEGVPQLSVSYWVFAGPALLWVGAALLTWRLVYLLLTRGRPLLTRAIRPVAGPLAATVGATLARQRRPVAHAVVLLTLALSFAASTATFNATYRQQSEVDAQLTNGADVTVAQSPGADVGPDQAARLAAVPGVRGAEPLQHRYAYVGSDLQDLYGVRPHTIADAVHLQDTWFRGGSARDLMSTLAAQPDNLLVSAETVTDFQLHPGDLIRLRLVDARTGALVTVPFHYAGVALEFPTAPRDSFLVANADYVAQRTGSDAVATVLIDTGGAHQRFVAGRIRQVVGSGAQVSDLQSTRAVIGSSLTAVDLSGLTRVELSFAVVLATAAGGLVLMLALTERRRTFVLASALGATRRQLRAFVLAEAGVVTVVGTLMGALLGWALSRMLVQVLNGVFDPPPDALTVPWAYLALTVVVTVAAIAAACLWFASRVSARASASDLRAT
jgi:putative ABC transport system permease protein